ncbi:hypothetical protein ZOSMA_68G00260 [Zostera marina]|uniref:Uncharacterized protein n=1 Tax=Zostera marina TaxID=29655 RepID=A0A0K9NRM4_ZOSMR|nr:hypothetical protein ZOSMA_68G00260 [Zostera marina]
MEGENETHLQEVKRVEAAVYDYDKDPRWSEYWSNVLIPPNLASRSYVVDHFKRKFYQKYIDLDLIVGPMPSSSSQSSGPSISNTHGLQSWSEYENSQNMGSNVNTSRTEPPSKSGNFASSDIFISQIFIFALIISILLCVIPRVPTNIANVAYRLSFLLNASSSLYFMHIFHNMTKAWSLTAIQERFPSIVATKNFSSFAYCLVFLPFPAKFKFALLPLFFREIEHISVKSPSTNLVRSSLYRRYLDKTCLWVETNTSTINNFNSNAEIALGFLLILALFSWQRDIIQTVIYWNLLKFMSRSPCSMGYHQCAWARIGRTVYPFINRYIPFLNTPLLALYRWWIH